MLPASTVSTVPVMFFALLLSRNSTASATSSGEAIRRSALRRLVDIDDVANAVEFLLSDRAKNITGTVLTVDAGNTA